MSYKSSFATVLITAAQISSAAAQRLRSSCATVPITATVILLSAPPVGARTITERSRADPHTLLKGGVVIGEGVFLMSTVTDIVGTVSFILIDELIEATDIV